MTGGLVVVGVGFVTVVSGAHPQMEHLHGTGVAVGVDPGAQGPAHIVNGQKICWVQVGVGVGSGVLVSSGTQVQSGQLHGRGISTG